jgi:formylglycine-generating enzyme required for sulfatase activity
MKKYVVTAILASAALAGWGVTSYQTQARESTPVVHDSCLEKSGGQVWVDGRSFTMGENESYKEEGPEHEVNVDGFWIDTHEVTNGQFAKFAEETDYVTVAERTPNPDEIPGAPPEMLKPGSVVFSPPKEGEAIDSWWAYVPGANWKHPEGPTSSIDGKEHYPVVHISFEDAQEYAKWAGRELPTEAQHELASRAKLEKETYAWGGKDVAPEGVHKANTWQGYFPIQNTKEDGYEGLAPIGCYDPNEYGAYDMIGNVWEWTANWYAPKHNPKDNDNPKGPNEENSYDKNSGGFPVRVIKGGSFLCAPNFCYRYRPAARHAQDTGLGASHIGFRTVLNKEK